MSETPAAPAQLAHLLSYVLINREAELMVTVVLNKLGTPVRLSYRKGDSRARPRTTACASQCRLTSTARRGGASRSNCSCPSLRSGRTLSTRARSTCSPEACALSTSLAQFQVRGRRSRRTRFRALRWPLPTSGAAGDISSGERVHPGRRRKARPKPWSREVRDLLDATPASISAFLCAASVESDRTPRTRSKPLGCEPLTQRAH